MIGTAALAFADPREAADLGAFLTRLLRFDRAAAVRLLAVPGPQPAESAQSAESEQPGAPGGAVEDGGVLAVYGRLPLGGTGVLALRTARLAAQPRPPTRRCRPGNCWKRSTRSAAPWWFRRR